MQRVHGEAVQAIHQRLTDHIAMIRVRFGGGMPTLPPPPTQQGEGAPDDDGIGIYPEGDGPEFGA